MKPTERLASTVTPDGSTLELLRHDRDYVIRAEGYDLMTSRQRGSEEAMMALACPEPGADACVLVGGLGMGFTLAATLALLPATAKVVVSELVPAIVEWNRGPLGELAGHPLDDPRTELVLGDVADVIRRSEARFDAILLDVDNGPEGLTRKANDRLYDLKGLRSALVALKPNGVLAVWSSTPSKRFTDRLRAAGFRAEQIRVGASEEGGGARSVIWIATPAQAPHGSDATRPRRDERARLRSRRGASARNSRRSPGRE
jgi:spermidine synthase